MKTDVVDAIDRIYADLLDGMAPELDVAMRNGELDEHDAQRYRLAKEASGAIRTGTRADVDRAKRNLARHELKRERPKRGKR